MPPDKHSEGNGRPFRYSLAGPYLHSLLKIERGAAGRIEAPEVLTNPETRNQYRVSSLIEEAIASSRLEGAATTRQAAKEMIRGLRPAMTEGRRLVTSVARTTREDLEFLAGLVGAGTIRTVLDRSWVLEQMADAHRYVELGEKTGAVVIEVGRKET